MSASAEPTIQQPLFALPGFYPDAVGFAFRTTVALLLAYFFSFAIQLDSASSAGVCVAIVAQPTIGMALSKAAYRMAGTVLGGIVALGMVAAFPQDRTMLLVAFTLWLGACTFVAALLRDFRSYGAVLCGYTVGIVAVFGIDAPQGSLAVTLDRVLAIAVGIIAVAVVNIAFSGTAALDALIADMRARTVEITGIARTALRGGGRLDDATGIRMATEIVALESMATHLAVERADGPTRSAGARSALAGLLGMLSASRAIAAVSTEFRADCRLLGEVAANLDQPAPASLAMMPGTTLDAFLLERSNALLQQGALVQAGLLAVLEGERAPPPVRLRVHYDIVGAAYSAGRTMIAVALGSLFCVYSGWAGTTGLLVQQAAFTALLGMQPNPTQAGVNMAWSLPIPALAAGLVGFILLPGVSGFVPFALATGWVAFGLALLSRHPRVAPYGPGLLLYFTLLLAPANQQLFDLSSYLNNLLIQVVALLFMVLAFQVIFPVSRRRRFYRIAKAIARDLRHTLLHGQPLDSAAAQSVHSDRLVQAGLWLGAPTPARLAVMHRLYAFAELDLAMRRAWSGLGDLTAEPPLLAAAAATARRALAPPDPAAMAVAAESLLRQLPGADRPNAVLNAISGLYGARLLLLREERPLRHYGLLAA